MNICQIQNFWKVSVTSYEVLQSEKSKKFTKYHIVVDHGNRSWTISKLFQDFRSLYISILKEFPEIHLKFPSRKLFGSQFDHSFLKERRIGLDSFVKDLVNHPALRDSPLIEQFFFSAGPVHFGDIASHRLKRDVITRLPAASHLKDLQKTCNNDSANILKMKTNLSSSHLGQMTSFSLKTDCSAKSDSCHKLKNVDQSHITDTKMNVNSHSHISSESNQKIEGNHLLFPLGQNQNQNDKSLNRARSTSSFFRSVLRRTLSFFSLNRHQSPSTAQKAHMIHSHFSSSTSSFGSVLSNADDTISNDSYSSNNSISNFYRRLTVHDFELIKIIGKGSFGKVILARFKYDGKLYAIKVISKDLIKEETDYRHIMSERNILSQNLNHPFLIQLKCTFQSETKLYIVLQYVNGGELFYHLQRDRKFNETKVKFYAAEIVSAFEYLHDRDIVYRDLKPENILLDSKGHVILVDFGLAKEIFTSRTTSTFCGTPEYLSPEIILNHRYGKSVDWWCLGAVIYEMLVGLPPFYSKNRNEIFEKILYDDIQFPSNGQISSTAKDFILKLLRRNPSMRLGCGPLGTKTVKNHPFFEGIDWNKIYSKKYQAPFMPPLKNDYGLDNFDPEFLKESISYSILNEPFYSSTSNIGNSNLTDDDVGSSISSKPISISPGFGSYSKVAPANENQNLEYKLKQAPMLFNGFSYSNIVEISRNVQFVY